jgi:hypothetical protein
LVRIWRWRWWIVVAAVVAVVAWRCWPLGPLQAHTGDGTFADLSWRARAFGVPVFDVRGFSVSMPGFDMGDPHQDEYRVASLPDIGRDCMLYLAIDDPQYQWLGRDSEIHQLRGRLRLEVIDGRGEVVRQAEGPLGEWVWGNWRGAHRLHKMFAMSFPARHDQEYTLRVSYSGDQALAGMRGYCYLECGARK